MLPGIILRRVVSTKAVTTLSSNDTKLEYFRALLFPSFENDNFSFCPRHNLSVHESSTQSFTFISSNTHHLSSCDTSIKPRFDAEQLIDHAAG